MDDFSSVRGSGGSAGYFGYRLPVLRPLRHPLPWLRDDSGISRLPAPGFCGRLAIPSNGLFPALSVGALLAGWGRLCGQALEYRCARPGLHGVFGAISLEVILLTCDADQRSLFLERLRFLCARAFSRLFLPFTWYILHFLFTMGIFITIMRLNLVEAFYEEEQRDVLQKLWPAHG